MLILSSNSEQKSNCEDRLVFTFNPIFVWFVCVLFQSHLADQHPICYCFFHLMSRLCVRSPQQYHRLATVSISATLITIYLWVTSLGLVVAHVWMEKKGLADVLVVYVGSVSQYVLRREYVDEISQRTILSAWRIPITERGWTPGIPAAIGFIYVGKGVESRGEQALLHTC